MAIYDYLPTFAEFEPNNLKGLQPGFVVAQMNVKENCTLLKEIGPEGNKVKVLENGHICTIGADGVDIWAANKPRIKYIKKQQQILCFKCCWRMPKISSINPRRWMDVNNWFWKRWKILKG